MAENAYISLPIEADYDLIVAEALDYLTNNISGWVPRESHLEVWLIEALARMVSESTTVASRVPPTIFRYFGQSLLAIPAISAAKASVPSTWVLRDTLGHTIPAGTVAAYAVAADRQVYFTVENPVTVPAGTNQTANGEVTLIALDAGAAANGLVAGVVQVVDALAWVDQITTTAATSGGIDAETDEEYLDRLRSELRLLTPRPILPDDFAILARRIAGVDRAKTIDGYDPSLGTYNNERMVTVALADVAGNAVSSGVKAQVQIYLDSLRETNFAVLVTDPTYYDIDVTAVLKAVVGADPATVQAAAEAAVESYLDPQNWDWTGTVRKNELIALLDRVIGVDYVESVTVPAADVVMTGPAPLARSRTVSIAVS